MADLQSSYGASFDYKPDRHTSPTLPPVPHNSLSDLSESDSSSSDSTTQDPIQIQPPRTKFQVSTGPTTSTRAYAALASIYDLPPCPPPPPLLRSDTNSSNESVPNDYQSGIMMAARRIDAALCPPKPARSSWDSPTAALTTQSAFSANSRSDVIPGWTDGSSDWRASVYNFSAPRDPSKPRSPDDDSRRAYKTFVASSHRSRGVYSTLTDSSIAAPSSTISLPSAPSRSNSEVDHLVNKFSQSLARRSESRANMALHHALSTSPTGSTHSLPTVSASNRRREVPILKPGAEGKLLVPNVKMRRTSSTASSLDGTSTSGSFSHTMTRVRSPLSRQNSDLSVEESEHDTMRSSLAGQERAPEGVFPPLPHSLFSYDL